MSDTSTTSNRRQERNWPSLVALLLFALAVRAGVLVAMPGGLDRDPDGYRRIAENVLRSGVYSFDLPRSSYAQDETLSPTAYRPPLYPLLLTKFDVEQRISPLRVGLLHLFLGVATVWLTWHVARLWKLGHWSLVAGALVACDPILLNQSTQVMTETLATFLAVLALFSLTRLNHAPTPWNAALAGGAIGLAVLCRPTFLPWLVLAALATPFLRASVGLRLANLAAFAIAAAAVLAPWTIRNYQVFGRPIVTTTHGGYTLALGNNSSFYDYLREGKWGTVWNSTGLEPELLITWSGFSPSQEPELDYDELAYRVANESIREQPFMFAYACLYRVGQLWSPLPHDVEGESPSPTRQLLRFPVAVWYVVVFVLAIGGACSLRRQLIRAPWVWGILLSLAFTVVHTLYWSNLRMRAPLMPFICLLAAIGAGHLVHYLRKSRKRK